MRKPLLVSMMTPEELEALRERQTARAAAELEARAVAKRERHIRWRADNPEKVREQNRIRTTRWYAKNPDKAKANSDRWRAENPEKVRAAGVRLYAKNPEKARMKEARWRAANLEKVKASKIRLYAKNPEKVRASHRKSKYGITQEQWDALFTFQGNCCANCGSTEPGSKKHWSTDHDHVTGEVRGILCHPCNIGLGHLRDDIDILLKAVEYLKNPPARKILKCEST